MSDPITTDNTTRPFTTETVRETASASMRGGRPVFVDVQFWYGKRALISGYVTMLGEDFLVIRHSRDRTTKIPLADVREIAFVGATQ